MRTLLLARPVAAHVVAVFRNILNHFADVRVAPVRRLHRDPRTDNQHRIIFTIVGVRPTTSRGASNRVLSFHDRFRLNDQFWDVCVIPAEGRGEAGVAAPHFCRGNVEAICIELRERSISIKPFACPLPFRCALAQRRRNERLPLRRTKHMSDVLCGDGEREGQ